MTTTAAIIAAGEARAAEVATMPRNTIIRGVDMNNITWGPERKHDGSPNCPADARDVPCMVKGPEWEEWRTLKAHTDHTEKVYWPNVTAYRLPASTPDAVLADLVAALEFYGDPGNWETKWVDRGCGCCSDSFELKQTDGGNVARAALTAAKEKLK